MAAKIDDKGRLKIPTDFRRVFEELHGLEVFTTSIHGDSALLYPLPIWQELEMRLLALPATDRIRQRFLIRVNYYGQQGRLDSQGRLVVPPILREAAAIEGEVVVCGSLDHLEVWNHGSFVKRLKEESMTDEDFHFLTERGV